MTWGDDVLTVLPGTLPFDDLVARLKRCDAAVVMKLGRNFEKVRAAFAEAGLLDRARLCRARHDGRRGGDAARREARRPGALFLADPAARPGAAAVSGALYVIGLGPGPADWLTPEASRRCRASPTSSATAPMSRASPRGRAWLFTPATTASNCERAAAALRLAAEGRLVGRRLRRRSRRVRDGGGGDGGDRARARRLGARWRCRSCRGSARCRRRRRGSARRSAAISARSRSPTI